MNRVKQPRLETTRDRKLATVVTVIKRHHVSETLLAVVALLLVVIFVVLHVVIGNGSEIWWILAVSTALLAVSDLVRRGKR